MGYLLTFSMGFDEQPDLDNGRLCLRHLTEGTIKVWTATSSIGAKQGREDFHQKGGLIPPEYRCGIKNWEVLTKPIPMPQVRGVEGNFYKINPHVVTTDKGGSRGDFGIHLDANQPGSLGCIVMTKDRFSDFEFTIKTLSDQGIKSLPLFVTYS
jgi:hypothetical protein